MKNILERVDFVKVCILILVLQALLLFANLVLMYNAYNFLRYGKRTLLDIELTLNSVESALEDIGKTQEKVENLVSKTEKTRIKIEKTEQKAEKILNPIKSLPILNWFWY